MEEFLLRWGSLIMALLAMTSPWLLYGRTVRRTEMTEQKREITEMKAELDDLKNRAAHVESQLEHMPDKDVSHRLEMAIARLEGRLETMDERMKPVAAMANRVHEQMFREAIR